MYSRQLTQTYLLLIKVEIQKVGAAQSMSQAVLIKVEIQKVGVAQPIAQVETNVAHMVQQEKFIHILPYFQLLPINFTDFAL